MTDSWLVTIPNIQLLSVGEWKAHGSSPGMSGLVTFTEDDLANIIASQDAPDVKEPRLILGHTGMTVGPEAAQEGFFGEQPAIGKFTNLALSSDGQEITADLVGVPKWLAEILPTAYPQRSVEVYWNVPSGIPDASVHACIMPRVALLGVNLPAVATLDDLKVLFSEEGPEDVELDLSQATRCVAASRGDIMPNRVAASVQYEDVRRDFYNNFATEESGRYWWWIRAVYVDPPLLIVDDDEESLWAVPYSVKGEDTEFGDPVEIKTQYVEKETGKVAAQLARGGVGRQYAKAESRPSNRQKETTAMDINVAALRTLTGLTPEQLPDDATEEQIKATISEAAERVTAEAEAAAAGGGDKPPGEAAPTEEPAEEPAPTSEAAASGVTVDREAWEEQQRNMAALRADLDQRTANEREGKVVAAIKGGKIPPSRKDHYVKLMEKDRKGTEEFLDSLEATIPVEQREVGVGDDTEASKAASSDYDLSWLAPHERARVEAARAGQALPNQRIIMES